MKSEKYIKNKYGEFRIEGDMAFVHLVSGIHVDMKTAQDLIRIKEELLEGTFYPVLAYVHGHHSSDKAARDFLAHKPEGTAGITAAACIAPSVFARIFLNAFIHLSRPPIPIRLFESEAPAIRWLKKFVPKEELV